MLTKLSGTRAMLFEDDLDDAAMWRLVASCDVVLSLHRLEGYALPRQGHAAAILRRLHADRARG